MSNTFDTDREPQADDTQPFETGSEESYEDLTVSADEGPRTTFESVTDGDDPDTGSDGSPEV